MTEERLPSGWLPPKPPDDLRSRQDAPERPGAGGWAVPRPPSAPQEPPRSAPRPDEPRPPGTWPRRTDRTKPEPSSPMAVGGIAVGAIGLVLLVLSAGAAYLTTIALSLFALLLGRQARKRMAAGEPGRPGQARAAIVVAGVGLGLAGLAAIVWIVLSFYGITPSDLQDALEREADRLRAR